MDVDQIQIVQAAAARIPTDVGQFQLAIFTTNIDRKEHLAAIMGDVSGCEDVLVRVHSECFTGDVLGSRRCDCGEQLQQALEQIAAEGRGIVIYLRQEGRGIGLIEKLKAYNLQDDGLDTVDANLALGHDADERDYTIGGLILKQLNVNSIHLITNNPSKIEHLQASGVTVSSRLPSVATRLTAENVAYLQTKAARMRHLLTLEDGPFSTSPTASPLDLCRRPLPAARPLVTLTYAQSIDGSIAARQGQPTPISGPESMMLTHQLRARHDGILVGIETVLSDNPRLNVRLVEGSNPTPIVLDSHLRLTPEARLFDSHPRPIVLTRPDAPAARRRVLEQSGARILDAPPDPNGRPSLPVGLAHLHTLGISRLMVEGGGRVIQSFLAARLADQAIVTIALRFMGGYHVMNGSQPAVAFESPQQMQLADDLVVWGILQKETSSVT